MLEKEPLFPIKDNFTQYKLIKSVLEYGNPELINNPQISIIVPICNHPEYLKETILSILNQDYDGEFEVIVVDNNMTQPYSPNYEIIKELSDYRVLYYRHEKDIKFAGNCNRGVELARGQFISFCHDDDLFMPHTLSCLMQIQKETGNRCIIASYNVIDEKSNLIHKVEFPNKSKYGFIKRRFHEESLYWLIARCAWLVIGSLWNKDCFIKCGGFSPNQAPCEDYAIQAIYASLYGSVFVNEPTFCYRMAHNASKELCKLFPERDIYIMEDMVSKIRYIPRWWLKTMISISAKNVHNSCEYTWGEGNSVNCKSYTMLEKLIKATNNFMYRRKTTYIMNIKKCLR